VLLIPKRHRQTDGQTDGRTDGRLTVALPRSALASRGNNTLIFTAVTQNNVHSRNSRHPTTISVTVKATVIVTTVRDITAIRIGPVASTGHHHTSTKVGFEALNNVTSVVTFVHNSQSHKLSHKSQNANAYDKNL